MARPRPYERQIAEGPQAQPTTADRDRLPLIRPARVHRHAATLDGRPVRVELEFFKAHHMGQCWSGLGRDAAGNFYLGVSTHLCNSYLYRYDAASDTMRFVGDLLSHVRHGGPDHGTDNGKIHSSFRQWDGCMYFLSHYGTLAGIRHGGHLWRYDPAVDAILDLGIPVPKNTNFCLSEIDPQRNCSYMVSTPDGITVRYDYQSGRWTHLEQTPMNYVRLLPMDAEGCVYVVWDDQIHGFDPRVGRWRTLIRKGEGPAFGLMSAYWMAPDRATMHFLTYRTGELWKWAVGTARVEPMGRMHPDDRDLYLYNLHLGPDGRHVFCLGACHKREDKGLYAMDLASGRRTRLLSLNDILDVELAGKMIADIAHVDFTDVGGLTGDDGAMYCGFTAGISDQDANAGGITTVALCRLRVVPIDRPR